MTSKPEIMTKPKSNEIKPSTLRKFRNMYRKARYETEFLSEHNMNRNTVQRVLAGETVSYDTKVKVYEVAGDELDEE